MLGGFADTRRTNANAGDLHSAELQLQVLRRVRSMAEQWDLHTSPTLHPRHRWFTCSIRNPCLVSHHRSSLSTWAKVAADEWKRDWIRQRGGGVRLEIGRSAMLQEEPCKTATRTVIRETSLLSLSLLSQTNAGLRAVACLPATSGIFFRMCAVYFVSVVVIPSRHARRREADFATG